MRRLLVFVHIPKTAGTTLRTVLGANEPGSRSRGLGNVFKGGGGTSKGLLDRLRKDNGPDLRRVALIRGHFPLGIRDYLPKDREVACFTFLREPADRLLSHYFAIREYGRGYGLPPLPEDASLDDAIERGYIHDNLQTRMLCGLPDPFGEVDDEMLEQAKANLRDGLVFFGLTERFDESLVLAKRRLGFSRILYRSSSRVNATRPRGRDVPAGLRAAAERSNRYDIELYRYAQELFEGVEERRELEFQVEVAALQAAKAEDEVDLEMPAPEGFTGDADTWRILLEAKATALRLEWERSRHRIPNVPATMEAEALGTDLRAAQARIRRLEREIEDLTESRSKTKKLEREVERLRPAAGRTEELEREVERLGEAAVRLEELEREVDNLVAAASRAEKLEQQVERLKVTRLRNRALQEEVERLKAAASRAQDLEREVERLTAVSSRAEALQGQLEEQVERLRIVRTRKEKLEQKLERLKGATSVREPQAPSVPSETPRPASR
jgi:hypothetical protein